jgi:hypothetical protein
MFGYINIKVILNILCCLDDLNKNLFSMYNYENGLTHWF